MASQNQAAGGYDDLTESRAETVLLKTPSTLLFLKRFSIKNREKKHRIIKAKIRILWIAFLNLNLEPTAAKSVPRIVAAINGRTGNTRLKRIHRI